MNDSAFPVLDAPVNDLSLLKGIPANKHGSVLRCLNARIAHFEKGDVLAGRVHAPACTRYLVEGEALIVRFDAAGNRSILGGYRKNSVVTSELAPCFCASNCLDVIATEPCTTIDFNISKELEACPCCIKHINLVKGNLVASLTDTNMQLVKRLDTLANRSTREKVLAYLQERALETGSRSFSIPYNRQELADYLYIERCALSRELGRMQREGILAYNRNRFVLEKSAELHFTQ